MLPENPRAKHTGQRARPLATPSNFSVTVVSGGQIDLTWTDRSSVETSYLIEQSLDGSTGWTQVGTTAANATNFSASGPFLGATTYHFRVRASTNSFGTNYSEYSPVLSLTTPAFPSQPTAVTVTTTTEASITLAWADVAGESSYRIERSDNGTNGWTQVGTAAANATSYSDAGLPENTRYYYRIVAVNAAGESALSRHSQRADGTRHAE